MGKNKLKRFAENESFHNLFQPDREELVSNSFELKGNWGKQFFKNDNPIVLEVGCGRGEYTVGMAKKFPDKNFIGLDIKGARLWRGAKTGVEDKMPNMAFIRTQAELIPTIFESGELSEIWITFPDPQIKFKRGKHRLTHPNQLATYKKVLHTEGCLHLKTDSEFLYGYTLGILEAANHEIIRSTHDLYRANWEDEVLEIKTHYEQIFLKEGKPITYTQFKLHD